jgi:hypothetical protein
MTFNWNFGIGDIISTAVFIIGFLNLHKKFTLMEFKVDYMWQKSERRTKNRSIYSSEDGSMEGR